MIHKCKVCGVTSDAAEFYNGVNTLCKECHKAKVRENRAAKAEYYREYDAERYQKDLRVRERHRRYQSTSAGKVSMEKSREKWKKANPEKRAAHVILGNRVRNGTVIKPDKCQECGTGGRIHGHHEDYSKPLDVIWVCAACHAAIHRSEQ